MGFNGLRDAGYVAVDGNFAVLQTGVAVEPGAFWIFGF